MPRINPRARIKTGHEIVLPLNESAAPWVNQGNTSNGSNWTSSGSIVAGVAGLIDKGVSSPSVGDKAVGPTTALLSGWTSVCMMAWVKKTGAISTLGLTHYKDRTGYASGVGMGVLPDGDVQCLYSGGNEAVSTSQPIVNDRWHHLVGYYDDANDRWRCYVDGAQVSQTSEAITLNWGTPPDDAEPWYIGDHDGSGRSFTGVIEDWRVLSYIPSDAELLGYYKRTQALFQ